MVIGYKALMRSAEISLEEVPAAASEKVEQEPTEEKLQEQIAPAAEGEQTAEQEQKDQEPQSALGNAAMAGIMVVATVLGILLAIGLFVWLPTFLYNLIAEVAPRSWDLDDNRFLRSLFEGILKIVILIAYMALVSLMKDIRRTFMYHGAEHKTIFCYEHSIPLTVENVRRERRFHPRCGTSFLILMLIVSIAIGLFIPAQFGSLEGVANTLVRAAIKLLLIPLTMGIGYELLKIAGKHDNIVTRVISAPGMWLQRITVREPTDDMIECAIKAFIAVLPEEEREAEAQAAGLAE
jgi:uncharacterized protein YqhQ